MNVVINIVLREEHRAKVVYEDFQGLGVVLGSPVV